MGSPGAHFGSEMGSTKGLKLFEDILMDLAMDEHNKFISYTEICYIRICYNRTPVERPPSPTTIPLYTTIFRDGQCFLFVRSLTDDNPSNATNDRVRWNFLPRGRPLQVGPYSGGISKNRGWRFDIRSQWWIITMLRLDTFEVIQLL